MNQPVSKITIGGGSPGFPNQWVPSICRDLIAVDGDDGGNGSSFAGIELNMLVDTAPTPLLTV